ncbi:MAG: protein kinase [Terriglobales bacterium]|jgi:eukaryotic-like serine/threonine-protein kinase
MTLASGTKLGPYEIQSPLGAGGMGEVYRARDTRLEREVAVKVLPADLSSDPSLRLRLEREAKAVSKLSHPHICTLHDIGHQDGVDFLVMELVEGETLEHRLVKGPLPPEQTIRFAAQIADALASAHKRGITHRDLKPSNIMLTKSGTKLMDFGLAKQAGPAPLAAALPEMTTEQSKLTGEGTIVGTFRYMAPEQLEGKEADARTDIFGLGEVIYEMATGKPAFSGKSRASLIAAILTAEPQPMAALQPLTPPALERVVKKCLAKDPDERWQNASDLASELNWIAEAGSQATETGRVPLGPKRWEHTAWLLAAMFFLMMMTAGVAWWNKTNQRPRPMYFHASVPFPANDLALSLDGRMLAIVAYSPQANNYVLWTYEVGGRRTSALDGTQGASYPFWSPDGKFIGFFADGKLKKIEVARGRPQVLCDAPNGRGGTWNRDGVIVFTPDAASAGLFRVSSSGGSPVAITKLDASRSETSHRWPVFLPDGRHFLYLGANFSGLLENNAIFLGSLDSQERRLLVSASGNAAYAEPGYLLYLRDNKTLVAQPFDLRRYVLSGEPFSLSDEVLYLPQVDRAVYSVSGGDVLVTQSGKGASLSQLTWFDRGGKPAGTVGAPGSNNNVRLSPDGRRVTADQTEPDGRRRNIWIHELAQGLTTTRLTFDPSFEGDPIWSPDGKQILFFSNRRGGFRLYLKNADGSGSEEEVADLGTVGQGNAWDWSRNGKYVLVRKANELWSLSWPERVAKPLLQATWTVQNAQFSPDGRWIAYASNETGSMQVYVSPFPSINGKWQVSSGGGQEPRWRQDGKELFFLSADGKMMAAAVTTGASFKTSSPVALFQTHRRLPVSSLDDFSYDVSGDGQRFLIATKVDEANAAPLSILLNWASQIEK